MPKKLVRIFAALICFAVFVSCSSAADMSDARRKKQQNSSQTSVSEESLTDSVYSHILSSQTVNSTLSTQSESSLSESSNIVSSEKTSSAISSQSSTVQSVSSSYDSSYTCVLSQSNSTQSSSAPTKSPVTSSSVSTASMQSSSYPTDGFSRYSGTRDPFYWPFSETSVWNMPIGSDAKLEKANFKDAYSIGVDDEYIVKVPEGSPTVDVYSPSSWNKRWPGSEKIGTMQVPENFYLADAQGTSTPNNCAAFIMPDGRTIKQLEPTCRIETGNSRIVGWLHNKDADIYGDGIQGTHYGSGLSAIGGSIRKGELTSDEPIRHAIKLNVWANKYCYYDKNEGKGYVWPADRNDSYAASGTNCYGGENANLRMGTLLTIPKDITVESLGIKSQVGKKIFYALQNYGCYIVDDSAWDNYSFSMESGVREEVKEKYGINLSCDRNNANDYYYDALKMIENLYIVTNNSPASIGGGGTPCQPLAPEFE